MTNVLIRGGRVIDPANAIDGVLDVEIIDGRIARVGAGIEANADIDVVDASGCIVTPGWIDAHVHLRDPGLTYKEDLQTGADAAAAGGFTRMCCMPNTTPPLDTAERVADIITRGRATGIHIHPIGTISVARAGLEIAPLREMAAAGAIGFSDDGDSTKSEDVMREALRLSVALNVPIMVHCEDPAMIQGGSMHRGAVSAELGDPGIPAEAEETYIERDLRLAEETGGWLHVLHVSTERGIRLIEAARERGVHCTAEVMPHHLLLTDEWLAGRKRFAGEQETVGSGPSPDSSAKVNPPLRPESDALGLLHAVQRGAFDFIATDHAPHAERDKPRELKAAAFGMSGLELALPSMAHLIERGDLDWPLVVTMFTSAPANTLGLAGGTLSVGESADVTVIDPTKEWIVSAETLRTRSANTPLLGLTMRGRAVLTICEGEVRHDERA